MSCGIKIFNPKSGAWLLLNLALKSLCSHPLSPSSGCYHLVFCRLMKAAGFHGYLQACSRLSCLGGPRTKQIMRQGLWHNKNNLDPMIRMEYWGQLGLRSKSKAQLLELGIKAEAEQQPYLGLLSARYRALSMTRCYSKHFM